MANFMKHNYSKLYKKNRISEMKNILYPKNFI